MGGVSLGIEIVSFYAVPPVCSSTQRMNASLGITMWLPMRSAGKSGSCISSYPLDGETPSTFATVSALQIFSPHFTSPPRTGSLFTQTTNVSDSIRLATSILRCASNWKQKRPSAGLWNHHRHIRKQTSLISEVFDEAARRYRAAVQRRDTCVYLRRLQL